ncbi:MAG: phosphomannomutase, partial [Deltaproteobacteria bacterium]|nr:phosphomannomutase [Deltaproteobacteria bacterium]
MGADLVCFMAYDIRGRIPDQLNEAIAFRIGRSYAEFLKPEQVVVGRDVRLSSESICDALSQGLMESGVNVFDIGLCGTEEVYFATFHHHMDGGIMITASHNPRDFNGMKLVREEARPVSGDTGLHDIRRLAEQGLFSQAEISGQRRPLAIRPDYIRHLLHYVDIAELKPLKIVINSGNGCAGPVMDALEPHLPFEFIKIQHQPDGTFPNGIP